MVLEDAGCEVMAEDSVFAALARLGKPDIDFCVIDYEMPQFTGNHLESTLKKRRIGGCYLTGHNPSEIEDKVDKDSFPILQKGFGLKNIAQVVKSLCWFHHREMAAL
jgi:CheY-like chemotaxis protein